MTNFEKFLEVYKEKYPEDNYQFTEDLIDEGCPFGGQVQEHQFDSVYDSYGNEDSKLKVVVYFPEYDVYVQWDGIRQSHYGEEWYEPKEVRPSEKVIQIFEEVKTV